MMTQQLSGSGRGRGVVYGTLVAVAISVLAPAAAEARPPRITERPVVVGTPQVGATLAAQGAEWEDGWAWALTSSTAEVTAAPAEPAPQPAPESAPGRAPSPAPAAPGPAGPAGTRLVIGVTKPGRIGKRTTIVIRRGKAPRRIDRCLMPRARKAVRCPGA